MSSCGFSSLVDQIATRRTIQGLSFNVLFVGHTGIGKTTLINSLFDVDCGDSPDVDRINKNVQLRIKEFRPHNKTIEMKLTIIETKGFNNQMDKRNSYKPIVDYIEARYEDYLTQQFSNTSKDENVDTRVHCCIYMIEPSGSGLQPVDLATLKQLHQRVCLIPVIAKADALTKQERLALAELIRHQISINNIEIYSTGSEPHLPFAIAASNELIKNESKRRRVRIYPWGQMDVGTNSEFNELKDLALGRNMLALIEYTSKIHYERYRTAAASRCMQAEREYEEFEKKYESEKMSILNEIERYEKLIKVKPFKMKNDM